MFWIYLLLAMLVLCPGETLPTDVKGGGHGQRYPSIPRYEAQNRRIKGPSLQPLKGQYICAGRLCRLPPGAPPPNCRGECQYPL